MDRRRFLATTGAGLTLASISGCLGLTGGSSPLRPVDCSPFDDSQPSSGWLDGGSESSSLNSISGSWHSPHHDNQNTGYNPDAEGPRECPSRRWDFRVELTEEHLNGNNQETHYSVMTSPVLHDDTLYFCDNENELYAVDVQTGELNWTKSLEGWYIYGPTYHDGVLYLSTGGYLRAIDAASRETLWSLQEPISDQEAAGNSWNRRWMPAAPTAAAGHVFAGTGHGVFHGIEASSGEILWSDTIETGLPGASEISGADENNRFLDPPAVKDGRVCIASDNGRLYAYDMQSGERQWVFQPGSRFQGAAVIQGESVFATASRGIYSVSLADGSINWEYHADAHYMSPAVDGETLIASAGPDYPNRRIIAVNAATGEELWRVPAAAELDCSASIAGGKAVVPVANGLMTVDIATGSPLWYARGGVSPTDSPLLIGDAVITGDRGGYVYAIQ